MKSFWWVILFLVTREERPMANPRTESQWLCHNSIHLGHFPKFCQVGDEESIPWAKTPCVAPPVCFHSFYSTVQFSSSVRNVNSLKSLTCFKTSKEICNQTQTHWTNHLCKKYWFNFSILPNSAFFLTQQLGRVPKQKLLS